MRRTSTAIFVVPPTRINFRFSRNRKSLACTLVGISPISSRKSVPPAAASTLPLRSIAGAGEGALLVAEQLALEERFGDRRAVDRHEGTGPTVRELVDPARKDFFARSAFPDQRDHDVLARNGPRDAVEFSHRHRSRDRLKNYVKLSLQRRHARTASAVRGFGHTGPGQLSAPSARP